MKKTHVLFNFILLMFLLSSCQTPEVNPFELNIDFYNQPRTRVNLTDNEKRALYETMLFYDKKIHFESQFLSLQSNDSLNTPLDLRFSNTLITNNMDTLDFKSFEILDLNTIGYEQLIDTGGLSGRLKLFLQLFDDFTDTFFNSKIELSNPPFRITAEENQVMASNQAVFELPLLLDFSIDITPETLIGFLDAQVSQLEIYEMPHGHFMTVPIIIDNIIQDVSIQAQIEVIVVAGYVVYTTIISQIDSLIIPVDGLIDNAETLNLSLTIDILLNFLYEKSTVNLPSDDILSNYRRVDTFSLPDVASIFG